MADEELELDVTKPKGSRMTNILLIVLILLVLILGGAAAWLFLAKGDDSGAAAKSDETAEKVKGPLQYLTLVPEFVVNFGPDSKVRYLQVDLQVSSRDEEALAAMLTYMPVIRNDILVLLSGQSFDDLKSRAGKEALQQKILNKLNMDVISAENDAGHGEDKDEVVAEENTTENDGDKVAAGPIENVYFISFIMQ